MGHQEKHDILTFFNFLINTCSCISHNYRYNQNNDYNYCMNLMSETIDEFNLVKSLTDSEFVEHYIDGKTIFTSKLDNQNPHNLCLLRLTDDLNNSEFEELYENIEKYLQKKGYQKKEMKKDNFIQRMINYFK